MFQITVRVTLMQAALEVLRNTPIWILAILAYLIWQGVCYPNEALRDFMRDVLQSTAQSGRQDHRTGVDAEFVERLSSQPRVLAGSGIDAQRIWLGQLGHQEHSHRGTAGHATAPRCCGSCTRRIVITIC
jgi:hypothetical protein